METLTPVGDTKLLHHRAQDAIRDYVLGNKLGGGDPLPGEMELARRLGIGRNSVREAIRALETLGVLEVRRGRGAFVREFSFEPLLDSLPYGLLSDVQAVEELLEIRCLLEAGMVDRAISSLDDDARDELRTILNRMETLVHRGEPFEEEDRAFHAALFRRVGNDTFLRLLDIFWSTYRRASGGLGVDPDPERTWREHADILEAIDARDAERARAALEEHYSGLQQRLSAARRQVSS